MSRRSFVVTAMVLVLVTAVAVVGLLLQGGVIGPRAARPIATTTPGPLAQVALPELVVVPPSEGGCPGEQFRSPSAPVAASVTGSDGSRTDATVSLGGGSAILVVCFGAVSDRGDATERTRHLVDEPQLPGTTTGPFAVQNALGAAMTYTNTYGAGRRLTEWHVDHDGWAYAVGALQASGGVDAAGVAEQVIASWQWTPAG